MNLNRYTQRAQEAIMASQELASNYNHSQIEPEHLLLALLQQEDGVAGEVLRQVGADPATVTGQLEGDLSRRPKAYGSNAQPGLAGATSRVLQEAYAEANRMKDDYVSTEHLLLALVGHGSGSDAGANVTRLFGRMGITRDKLLAALTAIRGNQRVTSQNPEATYQALEKYGRDLTQAARQGKLDPVIGRDEEV
ncbi:MAG: type VI secretion system ATPase TssH, partial [Anaerolineae bacterium]|nr:type VI secretion system ATPase TssH [Anaerolineae bacterium]